MQPSVNKTQAMLQQIAGAMGMTAADYARRTRNIDYVDLRTIAVLLIRAHIPAVTCREQAHIFGYSDHSVVIHLKKRGDNRLWAQDEEFMAKYRKAAAAVDQWMNN